MLRFASRDRVAIRVFSDCTFAVSALLFTLLIFSSCHLAAQTGGEAAITGTVTDSSGAVVSNVSITATNTATGVATVRTSSGAGVYDISPLLVGSYTVTAKANGFQTFQQQNIVLAQGQTFGLNIALRVGNTSETVTVSTAPPALDTADAQLGGNITSDEFLQLPLLVSQPSLFLKSWS